MEKEQKFFEQPEADNFEFDDTDEEGFVRFGDVSNRFIPLMQVQYSSRYLNGLGGSPNLGEGLRTKNPGVAGCHTVRIHKDDIPEFVRRYREYEAEQKRLFSGE
jgi:hypothetical protein